jgi:hypothetical protein
MLMRRLIVAGAPRLVEKLAWCCSVERIFKMMTGRSNTVICGYLLRGYFVCPASLCPASLVPHLSVCPASLSSRISLVPHLSLVPLVSPLLCHRSYLHGSYPVNPALARTDTIQTVRAIYLCLAQAQASQPFQVHRTPQSLMSLYISGAQLQSREAALARRPA